VTPCSSDPFIFTILNRIVSASLGARIVIAAKIEGGFGGGSIHRLHVRLDRSDAEQDLVVKLGPVQGAPSVADDDLK
jgi:hypothetical protein